VGDPFVFVVCLVTGAVLFVALVTQAVKDSVRREKALRDAPYEESEK
jgi:hypothetical protein